MSNPSASFSFPPPPPPPPKESNIIPDHGSFNTFNDSSGRGQSHGSQRGSFPQGRARGFRGGRWNDRPPAYRGSPQTHASFSGQSQSHTQKRSFVAAFDQKPQARSQAPPAVPSFSASLENLLPAKSAASNVKANPQPMKKSNLLGLTPTQEEGSDLEDDGDEEARLAAAGASGDLQFEYKGHVSTLRTPAEIAAWIAERRRRFPTQAKREAVQREAAERKQRFEQEKQAKQDLARKAREERTNNKKTPKARYTGKQEETSHFNKPSSDTKAQAHSRAEKLQRRLEKAKRDLAAAEAAALGASEAGLKPVDDDASGIASLSESSTSYDSDATSSSGSDSDSDSAPETTSSKTQPPPLGPALEVAQTNPPQVCSYFAKNGHCKFGKRCKYAHVQSNPKAGTAKTARHGSLSARKGLWQVMVEKEQEEEQKRILRAIIALGEAGTLEEPNM